MGKLVIKKEVLKGCNKVNYNDKDTGKSKAFSPKNKDKDYVEVGEEELKRCKIHILDKITIINDKGEELEELGTVNDFYEEDEEDGEKDE